LGKIAASLKPFPKVGGINLHGRTRLLGRKSGFGGCERLGGLSAAGKGLVLVQNS